MLTLEQVNAEVERIRSAEGDDEVAHGLEDDLRQRVLEMIADGVENPREYAAAVLKTSEIDFQRWCA